MARRWKTRYRHWASTGPRLVDEEAMGRRNYRGSIITIGNAVVVEGNSGATLMVFQVGLSTASSRMVRVNFATSNVTAMAVKWYNTHT